MNSTHRSNLSFEVQVSPVFILSVDIFTYSNSLASIFLEIENLKLLLIILAVYFTRTKRKAINRVFVYMSNFRNHILLHYSAFRKHFDV